MTLRFGVLWPFRNPESARVPWRSSTARTST